ncbi:hypothetical protein FRC07_013515 [Ceratobasidium sp. 392]|nr:hypothetical protein FRC07_013515 [Ceratobasidium sp. 392]
MGRSSGKARGLIITDGPSGPVFSYEPTKNAGKPLSTTKAPAGGEVASSKKTNKVVRGHGPSKEAIAANSSVNTRKGDRREPTTRTARKSAGFSFRIASTSEEKTITSGGKGSMITDEAEPKTTREKSSTAMAKAGETSTRSETVTLSGEGYFQSLLDYKSAVELERQRKGLELIESLTAGLEEA